MKKTPSINLVLFLLVISSCNKAINSELLNLELVFTKKHFKLNEKINCSFKIINNSKDSIGIFYPLNLGFADDTSACLRLVIKTNNCSITTQKKIHYQFIKSTNILFIQSKNFKQNTFPISDFYPLPDSGTYQLKGIYNDTIMIGNNAQKYIHLESDWHKVTISK